MRCLHVYPLLNLVPQRLKRQITKEPVPLESHSPGPGHSWFAILLVDASQVPQERTGETACLSIRQRLADFLHLVLSTVLRGGRNLGMLPLPHYLRRDLFAPIPQIIIIFYIVKICQYLFGSNSVTQ